MLYCPSLSLLSKDKRGNSLFGDVGLEICGLSVNPEQTKVAVSTTNRQVFVVSLSQDLEQEVQLLGASWHGGSVMSCDVCLRKPLVATCGMDRSVRIWNYADRSLNLVTFFPEEATAVALHPSGVA